MGAVTWLAHTEYEYARLLVARGPGDRDRLSALPGGAAAARRADRNAGAARAHPGARAGRAEGRPPDGLSSREVQILGLVAKGLSNREIGAELFISEHTVANHIRSILRKSGCANRTEAASYAHRLGLVKA